MSLPKRLLYGYANFRKGRYASESERYLKLGEGQQKPTIMMIACCDSRAAPETIFDAGPGEMFVVRNVANLVPPYTPDGATRAVSAALEFAVVALRVKHIVVLGHGHCGGIRAYAERMKPLSPGDFIGKWMELITPAERALGGRERFASDHEYHTALEQQAMVTTLENLMTFPWVCTLVERSKLQLHAAHFAIGTGLLSVRDPQTGVFEPLAGVQH